MDSKKKLTRDVALILAAAVVTELMLKIFVSAADIVPGGFIGVSVLVSKLSARFLGIAIPFSAVYWLLNVPGTILAWRNLGKRFVALSFLYICAVAAIDPFVPNLNAVHDPLLVAVFGGILNGIYNALALSADASCGSTDFITLTCARKLGRSCWNELFAFNAALIAFTGCMYGWEAALYSIILQFVNTKMLNHFDSRYHRVTVVAVTDDPEPIRQMIIDRYHHTATIHDAIGGYSGKPKKVVYTICGEYECNSLVRNILAADPDAFVNSLNSTKVYGNFAQKPYA